MKKNSFGRILKELRTEKELSQKEFGEKLGFCNQTVSFWEAGRREPDFDTLILISDFFGVSTDYLLGKKIY